MEFEKLVKNLSPESRELLEKAVAIASSRSNFEIGLEHWLERSIALDEPELALILLHFDVVTEELVADLQTSLETLKTGNDGFPKISPDIVRLLFEAWMLASSQYSSLTVRPVHILLAAVENHALNIRLVGISKQFEKLDADAIKEQCESLLMQPLESSEASPEQSTKGLTKTPSLDQFTTNLTQQARDGKFDRVLGRDNEIRQIIDILCRRKQNNPILTGEAGVGKTAVVEGLALRIANGEVPGALKQVELMSLDMGLLQAGAGVKGEFENRLKGVIKEVQSSVKPIILFIDEAHTMIGAGNQSGAGDAANLLKPALARGELRTIAATTWAEYKKYFETDAALTRRFQVVKVEEPTEAVAQVMLRSIAPSLEEHHNVIILDEAVAAAVTLSHRYIAGRQLPDKCVSLLDTACARVNLSLSTVPAELEQLQSSIRDIDAEKQRLIDEQAQGYSHTESIAALEIERASLQSKEEELNARWEAEKSLVQEIESLRLKASQSLKNAASGEAGSAVNAEEYSQQLAAIRKQLADIQGSHGLLHECVDASTVAAVVADWTGIPVGRMHSDEIKSVLSLQQNLEERVIGQSHGLKLITKAVQTARAKLSDPNRPLGVFMLVGPSGVGKTETALALAEQLYGSEQNITVINMSEFKEEHKVSQLMGSPPGYVGYGEGGVLTEAVRRKPYSVILLDEMEKAHPGVQDIFYQVFDKGLMRDGEGRDIDFKNTVIIMTSNAASEQIENLCADPDTKPDADGFFAAIEPALKEYYKPAFLGRVNVIPYFPLEEQWLADIAGMQMNKIVQRIKENYSAPITFSNEVTENIVAQCNESDAGARRISQIINNTLLPYISEEILSAMACENEFDEITVELSDSSDYIVEFNSGAIANENMNENVANKIDAEKLETSS
ncbi:type VI secretion system ATPase TssH [Aurantivibrio plasticivorans]